MTLALYDRVQQTGTANTTVSFTLSGSVAGYQSFVAVGNGNTTYYGSFDTSGNWEVGLGTYSTTGPTLTRTTILSSSNGGLAVTFSGTVNVFITYPSEKSVNQDANGNVGIGTNAPQGIFQVLTSGSLNGDTDSNTEAMITGSDHSTSSNLANLMIFSNSAATAGFGGSIGFGGRYSGTASAAFARISGQSDTGTYTGRLSLYTRTSGSAMTEALRIDSSSNLNFKVANAGIVFNNSSALTNSTLNDYETGTWTPTLTADTNPSSVVYSSQTGRYTKIGNTVYVWCYMSISSISGGSGACYVSGLPFNCSGNVQGGMQLNWSNNGFVSLLATAAHIPINQGRGYLVYFNGGATTQLPLSQWTTSTQFIANGSYQATF